MTPQDTKELGERVRAAFASDSGEFRPFALFDDRLDCIRVIARDCSFTEIRVSAELTILQDNNPTSDSRKYCGFTIKGASHFCKVKGLSPTIPVRVTEVLDALLASSPNPIVRLLIDTFARPLIETERIDSVSFPAPSLASA